MDDGDKAQSNRLRNGKLLVGGGVEKRPLRWVQTFGVTHMVDGAGCDAGDKFGVCARLTHSLRTTCTLNVFCAEAIITGVAKMRGNKLRIQTVLYFVDGVANRGVDTGFAFNLFDGVDGGSVVFAAQLTGNLREAQM